MGAIYDPNDLPIGVQRADGGDTGYPGTPYQDGQVLVNGEVADEGNLIALEELPDSPVVERADQMTSRHTWRMSLEEAQDRMAGLYRGLVRSYTDEYGFPQAWKVLSANMQPEKGGQYGAALITLVEECMTADTPPDKYSSRPVDLGLSIIKHPRYLWAFIGEGYGSETEQLNQMVIRFLQDYMENPDQAYRNAIQDLLTKSFSHPLGTDGKSGSSQADPKQNPATNAYPASAYIAGTDVAKAAALEIINKYWRGEETPYLIGLEVSWTVFVYSQPYYNPGGYIEEPTAGGLPWYFWEADVLVNEFDAGEDNPSIFSQMAIINPQCYSQTGKRGGPLTISWLRMADDRDFDRTLFPVTRSWRGSPVGHWDPDLYTQADGPQVPQDFHMAMGKQPNPYAP